MAAEDFVHLHLHSDYSLLDGAIQHEALAEQAQRLGFKAIAVTDHGNMFGAMGFANAMKSRRQAHHRHGSLRRPWFAP